MYDIILGKFRPGRIAKKVAKRAIQLDPTVNTVIRLNKARKAGSIKGALKQMAKLDPTVNAASRLYKDLHKPKAKKKAAVAYKAAVVKARQGDPEARKVVGAVKQMAAVEKVERELAREAPALLPEVEAKAEESTFASEESEADSEGEFAEEEQAEEEPSEESESLEGEEPEFILGGAVSIGKFDFAKALKTAMPLVSKAAAMTPYGAAVNMALKTAGPMLQKGMSVMSKAKKGDQAALAKVEKIKALAAAGNPAGKEALDTLKEANAIQTEARGAITSAAMVSPPAAQGLPPVQVVVMMPGPEATRSVLSAASQAGSRFFVPTTSLYRQGLTP